MQAVRVTNISAPVRATRSPDVHPSVVQVGGDGAERGLRAVLVAPLPVGAAHDARARAQAARAARPAPRPRASRARAGRRARRAQLPRGRLHHAHHLNSSTP